MYIMSVVRRSFSSLFIITMHHENILISLYVLRNICVTLCIYNTHTHTHKTPRSLPSRKS